MSKILVLDDDSTVLSALQRSFRNSIIHFDDYEDELIFDFFNDVDLALSKVRHHHYDIIISDYMMPKMTGIDFLIKTLEFQPESIRILLTGNTEKNILLQAINDAKVFKYIEKPWSNIELLNIIEEGVRFKKQKEEDHNLALLYKVEHGEISEEEKIEDMLEQEEPGITKVVYNSLGAIELNED